MAKPQMADDCTFIMYRVNDVDIDGCTLQIHMIHPVPKQCLHLPFAHVMPSMAQRCFSSLVLACASLIRRNTALGSNLKGTCRECTPLATIGHIVLLTGMLVF